MNKEDIIRMAEEAGFVRQTTLSYGRPYTAYKNNIEEFAELVAAHECEKLKNVAIYGMWLRERDLAIESAVQAEREECAKICDKQFQKYGCVADKCAEKIRSRGDK